MKCLGRKNGLNMNDRILDERQNKLYILGVNILMYLLMYGLFLKQHFSVDSYFVVFDMAAEQQIKQCRYLNYFIIKIFESLGVNTVKSQSLFTFIFILSLAGITVKLTELVYTRCKYRKLMEWIRTNIIVMLSFVNVFILEWFLYPEISLFYALSLIFCVLAIHVMLQGQRGINLVLAFVFICCSLNCYQAAMPIFVIYCLFIIMIENDFKLSKNSFIYSMKCVFVAGMSSGMTLFLQKLAIVLKVTEGGDRDASFTVETLLINLVNIINLQKDIWSTTYGFLPRYLLLCFAIIFVTLLLVYWIRKHEIQKMIYSFLCLSMCYVIVFVPHLVTETQWFAQRTIVGLFSFVSVLILLVVYLYNETDIIYLCEMVAIGIVLINAIVIQWIGEEQFSTNKLDEEYAYLIENEIVKYENESGIKVKNIATTCDSIRSYGYKGIRYTIYDTNIRAYTTEWADVNMINYYNNKMYMKVDMELDIYEKNFKGKNWDYFEPTTQFIFVGDTLNIAFY